MVQRLPTWAIMKILSKPKLATCTAVSVFLCPFHFYQHAFLFLKVLKGELAMEVRGKELRCVPVSQGPLSAKEGPQVNSPLSRSWDLSAMKLACVLVFQWEDRAKPSGSSLSLGESLMFSINHEMVS